MKVIHRGRAKGKTTAMLRWLRAAPKGEHRVLVCHTNAEAHRLWREVALDQERCYRETGKTVRHPLESWQFTGPLEFRGDGVWSGVLMGRGGRIVLGFDNLDLWLQGLSHFQVGAVSLNREAGNR